MAIDEQTTTGQQEEARPRVVAAEALARAVVRVVAPTEAVMFDQISAAYRRAPARVRARRRWDESLGSGVVETVAVALFTPVILEVVNKVLDQLAGDVADGIVSSTGAVFRKLLRRKKAVEPSGCALELSTALNDEQILAVHRLALAIAKDAGMSQAEARLIADALVGRLVAGG